MEYRIAIVEDNATARTTLRGHLLPIENLEVFSYASGAELKGALRKQHFELLLMDFHLGQDRNGVEWIHMLREADFIRPSTGIIFLTSDRSPQTIGQIIDIQPDVLLIKPYTIASLTRQVKHYLSYRKFVDPVLKSLDHQDYKGASTLLMSLTKQGIPPRLNADVTRLKARILVEAGQTHAAMKIYESVLARSDKVLWAQWGKIKCQYIAGLWPQVQHELSQMVTSSLARDRAFEWLASLSFEQQSFNQVEDFLDKVKFSELSLPATRLKSLAYQKQDKVVEAIDLLQKKRAMHRSAKDRFNDFTFELAEFYLMLAEDAPMTNRKESLSQARKLVGIAGRNQSDPQTLQKRDYLLAFSSVLDNDLQKASQFLEAGYMENHLRTEPSILVIAAKIHHGLGEDDKANHLMALAKEKNANLQTISEQVVNDDIIFTGGEQIGYNEQQSIELNEIGTQLFIKGNYPSAMKHFYEAFVLSPTTAAFGLNLLQCMIESQTPFYKRFGIRKLLNDISELKLSPSNANRLSQLHEYAEANSFALLPVEATEVMGSE